MPLYDYQCQSCGHRFELRQSFTEVGTAACPICAMKSQRVFHSVPILFKGSGFYSTDYKKGTSSYSSNGSDAKGTDEKEKVASKAEDKAKSESKTASSEGSSSKSD